MVLATSCASWNRSVDQRGIAAQAALAPVGAPRRPFPFASADDLEATTRAGAPLDLRVQPIGVRAIRMPGLVQEQVVFTSSVTLAHAESNTARLYVFRHGPLGERPVVLWVPGLAVSDLAMPFLERFFSDALDLGADVVFYVPPYHLERTPAGFESGQAVMATDLADHLAVIQQGVSDLRRVTAWLRGLHGPGVGVFAGSLGASLSLQVARFDGGFDFFVGMIPFVDWRALLFERPEFAPVLRRLASEGHDLVALEALYADLEPARFPRPLPAMRLSILAADWDEVTPTRSREAWAKAWTITRVTTFQRGHTTMLLTPALYAKARALLSEDLASVTPPPRAVRRPGRLERTPDW